MSFVLTGTFAAAQPSPSKPPTATPSPSKPPKTTPTPNPKLDAKTEAELLQAEDRFIVAIQNGDAKALAELLSDYYADAFGQYASVATSKRGVLTRVNGGQLPAYRILKQRKLSHSVDLFTVEGLAKAERQISGDEPKDEWFRVRRLWTKTGDRWVLNAQMITPLDEPAKKEAEAKEKD